MALTPGTRLGSYEITGTLGQGGMGEVYRGRDPKLERDVAIKVLPASFAADVDRVARFEQEAKALAALNHPNIAQIYGLEDVTGASAGPGETATALVMELVEGPTLADRIAEGPIPVDEALEIATQIAEALEAAHGKQIIHRDLKPANVKLTPDGLVKLLDFGIAKLPEPTGTASGRTPTLLTPALTEAGVLLGTAAYMSPEQAKGKPIDQRADVWAFGVVLYEMLSGQSPFGAEDVTTTLARVLERDANVDALPDSVPPAVKQTIALCLEKDPRRRIRHIGDVKLALTGQFDARFATATTETARNGAGRVWRHAMSIAVGVILATSVLLWSPWGDAPEPLERRLRIVLPFQNPSDSSFNVSPDGRFLVVEAGNAANPLAADSQLWLWRLDTLSAEPLPGTEAAAGPFWSPDSRFVAFSSRGMLKTIDIRSRLSQTILGRGSSALGGVWTPDGQIVFANSEGGFSKVAAGGGEPVVVTRKDTGALHHEGPALLPDGRHILYFNHSTAETSRGGIYLATIATAPADQPSGPLIVANADVEFVLEPNTGQGYILYVRGSTLLMQRFDANSLELTGDPAPIADDVMGGTGRIAATTDGSLLIYRPNDRPARTVGLVWVDTDGNETALEAPERDYFAPRISPEGTEIAVAAGDDVWVWDERRNTLDRISFEAGSSTTPLWSLDGGQILYSRFGADAIVSRAPNGTGDPRFIVSGLVPAAMTEDESLIYGTSALDVYIVASDGNGQPEPLLNESYEEMFPALSPDGRWLAFQSDRSGRPEVYVVPFPDVTAGRRQVSTNGGLEPRWSVDGATLYFRNATSTQLLAATIEDGTNFVPARPVPVLDIADYDFRGVPWSGRYDVAEDGRFLFMKAANPTTEYSRAESTDFIFVENLLSGIRRREAGD